MCCIGKFFWFVLSAQNNKRCLSNCSLSWRYKANKEIVFYNQVTITLPIIVGCNWQKYENSPFSLNVCENVFPFAVNALGPESPESNTFPIAAPPLLPGSPDVTV